MNRRGGRLLGPSGSG